jgi:hypothetical protein
MASVTIKKADLDAKKPCKPWYLSSPEWNESQGALVYTDFEATVERLMSTPFGRDRLRWLVHHELVPMTTSALKERITKMRSENAAKIRGSK